MPMMEEAKKVIDELRNCANPMRSCVKCGHYHDMHCFEGLAMEAANLIEQQDAEIKKLQTEMIETYRTYEPI